MPQISENVGGPSTEAGMTFGKVLGTLVGDHVVFSQPSDGSGRIHPQSLIYSFQVGAGHHA